MSRISSDDGSIIEAIRGMGVGNPTAIRRMVIDIQSGHPVKIFVEHFGEKNVINVMQALDGIMVKGTEQEGEEG